MHTKQLIADAEKLAAQLEADSDRWSASDVRFDAFRMLRKLAAALPSDAAAAPIAWVRYRSDGGFEGPIMDTDSRMCDTRRGFWTPLYAAPVVPAAAAPSEESRPAKSHCQNGGDVCLAGNRDGVCCPEDSCDTDDGVRTAPRTYRTKPGESVMGIALRECGNEAEWRHILACNPQFAEMLPSDYFPVGTVLTLPTRNTHAGCQQ